MADNTVLNTGVGGDTIATDDIGGVKYQIVKLATGALDTATLALSGSGTATGAIRVELPTNGTGVVGLNAGTAVIGHVITDTGSTTAVTGTVTISGAVTEADGANTTLGAKADAKSTATDTTAITAMSVLKQISASVQAPPSQAVTNAGTFAVQAAQSGTWTVQPGNTANTTAWKVDGSAVTQPISGTITANAGTNLNTSALALDATLTGVIRAEDTASADADKGIGALAIRKATPANTSGTDGDYEYLQMSAGRLWASTTIDTALPAGTNVIGHVISDSGSVTNATLSAETTKVIGTINVAAAQTIAVTNAGTFAVQATLAAETTKVIGVTRTSDGAGNLLTSNSTTYTAKFGLDANILGTLGTAFSTAGKVDVKGADGDVFVRQTTGSNLHTVLDSGTLTTLTTLTGITNTVVTDDLAAAATGAAVPANAQYQGGIAKTALPAAASDGNLTGAMEDKFGRTVVLPGTIRDLVGTQTTTIAASTSETTIVTAAASVFNDLVLLIISNTSATAARLDFRDTTAGSILFSVYVPVGDVRGFAPSQPIPQTTVNTNWTAQSSASITDLRIYAVFNKNR